jgi:hypothetical protein
LRERGFIACDAESLFNSKAGSKAREWRLTGLPFDYKNPLTTGRSDSRKINQPGQRQWKEKARLAKMA